MHQSVPFPQTIPGALPKDISSAGVQQAFPMISKLAVSQVLPVPSPIQTTIPF